MPITEDDVDELLSKDQAADFLHVSRSTIDRMIRRKELDFTRVGSGEGRIRISKRALLDNLNRRTVRAAKTSKAAS